MTMSAQTNKTDKKAMRLCGIDRFYYDEATKTANVRYMLANPPKECEKEAEQIDKGEYASDCFGLEFTFNTITNQYEVVRSHSGNIYYIDAEGDRHYMEARLSTHIVNTARKVCVKKLASKGIIITGRKRKALAKTR